MVRSPSHCLRFTAVEYREAGLQRAGSVRAGVAYSAVEDPIDSHATCFVRFERCASLDVKL